MSQSASQTEARILVSPDDYLRLECEAVEKHEYYYGEVRAMAGASYAHNRICANLTVELGSQLRGRSCAVVGSDQRLQILNGNAYVYPDVTVVCGPPSFNETRKPETLLNPTLLVEVLSESTADKDRGEKFMLYRQIPSLQQYLMLDSQTQLAELYTRQPNGYWLFMETRDPAAVLDLSSVGCQVPLVDVYEGVNS
ncbi:hypothetical protein BEN47_06710 [Hymenobacter lapidarius]|uniref:Putative restriction endonuclease domain-containing protein n=1 Tax=Hymenobacter lapidarius TaxID=1908237 RepID=A0A1G1TFB4_9BACT|nr:Uma2 family endonuclease [Hymenobacter lapidarius]OGX89568.1 hypothetical protein BEN47_06710 [Hymenobacter lapidarius]